MLTSSALGVYFAFTRILNAISKLNDIENEHEDKGIPEDNNKKVKSA